MQRRQAIAHVQRMNAQSDAPASARTAFQVSEQQAASSSRRSLDDLVRPHLHSASAELARPVTTICIEIAAIVANDECEPT